jgi:hypothetical protein
VTSRPSRIRRNKDTVRRFDEVVERALYSGDADLSALGDLCAPDLVNHALARGRPAGLEGTRAFLVSGGRNPHASRWVRSVVVAEDDMVVQVGVRPGSGPEGGFAASTSRPARTGGRSPSCTASAASASPSGGRSTTTSG